MNYTIECGLPHEQAEQLLYIIESDPELTQTICAYIIGKPKYKEIGIVANNKKSFTKVIKILNRLLDDKNY